MNFVYTLLENGDFKIDNFQKSSPFASFLPGLSGTDGIPMWAFYVNRGQGLASFGVENKDNAMTEFYPADKAYQMVSTNSFRTFIKGKIGDRTFHYEPFADELEQVIDSLIVSDNYLTLKHSNKEAGLEIEIIYYTLPHQKIPGLVREVIITNNGHEEMELEGIDGLAMILPAGVSNAGYKEIGNTYKSWFDVDILKESIAYYYLRGSTEDEAEVSQNDKGNFYVSVLHDNESDEFLTPIFDRDVLFEEDLSLRYPKRFYSTEKFHVKNQISTNKVSSAFSHFSRRLAPNEQLTLTSLFGQVESREEACDFVANKVSSEYFKQYKSSAKILAKELTERVETKTAFLEFDAYVKQNYLDNGLRGGFPFIFENEENRQVFYLYSRKHGDLERDYNFFSISPEFFSQGNGNYRDMNQNRRMDVLIEPKVEDHTIRQFMNLIQLDGYNPLALKKVSFTLEDAQLNLNKYGFTLKQADILTKITKKGYTPGNIKRFVEEENVVLNVPFESFLTDLLSASEEVLEAEHGEGFWIDHWTYNLDLIDSYLSIYPEKKENLFFADGYRYFDSPASVKPQNEKYTVKKDGSVRQYHAVEVDKEKMAKQVSGKELWLKLKGQIFTTNLYSKLLLLAATKVSTIAPYGLGIEMEAGKPGWNDAMNGLPGMFGSGTSELYELKRLLTMLLSLNENQNEEIILPTEATFFLQSIGTHASKVRKAEVSDWKERTALRENYRKQIREGLSGEIGYIELSNGEKWIKGYLNLVEKALYEVENFSEELVPTYFRFDVSLSEEKEVIDVKPHAVTLFLEGIVKKMKLSEEVTEAKELYEKVKKSSIYDEKLKMYKTSESIKNEPIELGRATFFTPGWLENESIFLHMSYKYLLELIKNDLMDEFFLEMQTGIISFLNPSIYGRSILENSSFLASSANPDHSLHGKGFVARLSGSTVEFLNMWFELMFGGKIFTYKNDELSFQLNPKLSGDFFKKDGTVSVKLFGEIDVTYHNISRKNTYGLDGIKVKQYKVRRKNEQTIVIKGAEVVGSLAEKIRNREIDSIEVELG